MAILVTDDIPAVTKATIELFARRFAGGEPARRASQATCFRSSPGAQASGGRTKHMIPAAGVKHTTARPVGLPM